MTNSDWMHRGVSSDGRLVLTKAGAQSTIAFCESRGSSRSPWTECQLRRAEARDSIPPELCRDPLERQRPFQ